MSSLSRLLDRVVAGEEIIIARAGHPVARLTAVERPARRPPPGAYAGQIKIAEDFEAPLPDDMLEALYE